MGRIIPKDRISDLEAIWTPSKSLDVKTETDSVGNLFFKDSTTGYTLKIIPSNNAGIELMPYLHLVEFPANRYATYWDEFYSYSPDSWTHTSIGGGSVGPGIGYKWGQINHATGGNDEDNEQIQLIGWLVYLTSWPFWFSVHTSIGYTTDCSFMACLAITDSTLITPAGVGQCSDWVGFSKDDGDQNLDFTTCKDSVPTTTDTGVDITTTGLMQMGFYWDGVDTVTPFVDGVAKTAHTTNIPDDQSMTLSFALQAGSAGVKFLRVDWAKMVQSRFEV